MPSLGPSTHSPPLLSGVGFGICRRLLYSLVQDSPDDARPLFPRSGADEPGLEYPCAGLTLIMACRSRQRAEAARTQLLALFESDVARLRRSPGIAERVEAFRANLIVEIHTLDLASVQSTLAFAEDVARTWVFSLSLSLSLLFVSTRVLPVLTRYMTVGTRTCRISCATRASLHS